MASLLLDEQHYKSLSAGERPGHLLAWLTDILERLEPSNKVVLDRAVR